MIAKLRGLLNVFATSFIVYRERAKSLKASGEPHGALYTDRNKHSHSAIALGPKNCSSRPAGVSARETRLGLRLAGDRTVQTLGLPCAFVCVGLGESTHFPSGLSYMRPHGVRGHESAQCKRAKRRRGQGSRSSRSKLPGA